MQDQNDMANAEQEGPARTCSPAMLIEDCVKPARPRQNSWTTEATPYEYNFSPSSLNIILSTPLSACHSDDYFSNFQRLI